MNSDVSNGFGDKLTQLITTHDWPFTEPTAEAFERYLNEPITDKDRHYYAAGFHSALVEVAHAARMDGLWGYPTTRHKEISRRIITKSGRQFVFVGVDEDDHVFVFAGNTTMSPEETREMYDALTREYEGKQGEEVAGDYINESIIVWDDEAEEVELHYRIYYVSEFPRGKDGCCAFCGGDPCGERDPESNIGKYMRLTTWAETCPVCEGRPT